MTLRLTAGAGVGFSGACGLPLGWRARKPLPCAIRSSADLVPGHERRAPVLKHHLLALGPSLRPHSVLLCASCFSSLDAAFSSLFSVSCTRKEKVFCSCMCVFLLLYVFNSPPADLDIPTTSYHVF